MGADSNSTYIHFWAETFLRVTDCITALFILSPDYKLSQSFEVCRAYALKRRDRNKETYCGILSFSLSGVSAGVWVYGWPAGACPLI